MIKYRPARGSLSASIKEEETFRTMEDLLHFLHVRMSLACSFIGSPAALRPDDIRIGDDRADNQLTGYRNERGLFIRSHCIGYFSETEVPS